MKLVSMQPYFFPYLGHFDLMNLADIWIVYDTPQHISQGWVHRNRVLHPSSGWQYIVVPLKKHGHTAPINQIEISSSIDWKSRVLGQLTHYKRHAPFYAQTIRFLEECFAGSESNLARFNIKTLRMVSRRLGIEKPLHVFSEMNFPSEEGKTPEETAIEKCLAMGADEYINPPSGAALYSPERFAERGIRLTIQTFTNMIYDCGQYQFEPALSIIDVMMWNSPEQIKRYLDTWRSTNSKA